MNVKYYDIKHTKKGWNPDQTMITKLETNKQSHTYIAKQTHGTIIKHIRWNRTIKCILQKQKTPHRYCNKQTHKQTNKHCKT